MRLKHLWCIALLILATQIGCAWWLVHEERRNYRALVIETFKACRGVMNPWEKMPWD